jgi:hypothetical protein
MKKTKLLLAIAAILALSYIPKTTLYQESIWSFDKPDVGTITDDEALRRLYYLVKDISAAQTAGNYPVRQAYNIDRELRLLTYKLDFPKIGDEHSFLTYGDEAEYVRGPMWLAWDLEHLSQKVRMRFSGSAGELVEYTALQNATEKDKKFWFPELKRYPRTRYLCSLINTRVTLAASIFALLFFLRFAWIGCVFRRIFNPRTLQATCYFIGFCLSFFASPALAQTLSAKAKKKEKQRNEQPLVSQAAPLPAASPPPAPKSEFYLEAFGDFSRDRQQILRFTRQMSARTAAVIFNQNRQSLSGGTKLSLFAFGLRHKPNRSLTFSLFGGPQLSPEKGRVDQITFFAVAGYQKSPIWTNLVNRFSWGIDGQARFADRHVVTARVRPMPAWLAVEAEIKRTGNGVEENFWGPLLRVGRIFRSNPAKRLLGGLYIYPYRDFVKGNWDFRMGLAFNRAW